MTFLDMSLDSWEFALPVHKSEGYIFCYFTGFNN